MDTPKTALEGCTFHNTRKRTPLKSRNWMSISLYEEQYIQIVVEMGVDFTKERYVHPKNARAGCQVHCTRKCTSKKARIGCRIHCTRKCTSTKKRELDVEFTVRGNVHPTHPEPTRNLPGPTRTHPEPTRNLPEATRLPRVTASARSSRVNLALDTQSRPLRLEKTHPARWSGR